MTRFLSFLLHDSSKPLLARIFTPQTVATVEEFSCQPGTGQILFPTAQFLTYGLGCFIHDYRGIRMVQAPGQVDGINCVLALIPSLDLGLFIAANAESGAFTRALLFQLIDTFLDEKTDWNQQFLKQIKNT